MKRNTSESTDESDLDDIAETESKTPEISLGTRKRAYHFRTCDDIELIKEVTCSKPYDAAKITEAWNQAATNIGEKYSGDSARKRFAFLINAHKKSELVSKRRSGTEEEYNEREQLLNDIIEEMESTKLLKGEKGKTSKKMEACDKIKAEKLRDAAMIGLVKSKDNTCEPPPKKPKTKSVLELMAEDMKLKEKQLNLEERRLTLQENEQKLLSEERKQANEERKVMMAFILDNLKKQ